MKKKNENLYVILILIVLFGISIGYAVLTKTLNITGNSEVKQNTWDIHFENVQIKNGSVTATTPPIANGTDSVIGFAIQLDLPGDFYEFTVDVKNSGTIDAMAGSIEKTPTLTTAQAKYLNYIIEYQNGEQITSKQLVKAGEFVRLKVRVEYRTDLNAEDLPTVTETLNLGFSLNYVQADNTGISVTDNGVFLVKANGPLDTIGTVVTIGTEQFYVLSADGDNVNLLSMYNLYVGGSYNRNLDVWTAYGVEATGMQDENMKGMFSGQTIRNGITVFSNDNQKGTNYSDYNGSVVESYVNNYEVLLENKYDVDVVSARLITEDELMASDTFGCVKYGFCSDKYPWVYSTTYWTGTAYDSDDVWRLDSDADFNFADYDDSKFMGVRPVIVMKKSDITVPLIKPVANGDINEIGTIVTIGTEQFYIIGTEGDNVKLLSMYNLYVGGYHDGSSWTPYGDEVTGMQDINMKGYENTESLRKGTTVFSSYSQKGNSYSDYNGSIIEEYVNNYKNNLETKFGIDIIEARLITYDELIDSETFACVENARCSNKYPWIYLTSFWSGTPYDSNYLWHVYGDGIFGINYYSNDTGAGVRPVIVISKSLF